MQDDNQAVHIIIGRVWTQKESDPAQIHIMIKAPDDDSAIREALNALAERGYEEAEFDQIGTLTDEPIEEPHASAYQGALEGEIAIISYDPESIGEDSKPLPPNVNDESDADIFDPFDVLKDWKPDS